MKITTKILAGIFLLANLNVVEAAKPFDFDGDSKSDLAVIRTVDGEVNEVMEWFIAQSSNNALTHWLWGLYITDILVPADYDGDNKTDVAVWRASTTPLASAFYIINSTDNTVRIEQYGQQDDNPRIVGDYDGDGKADLAVFRRGMVPDDPAFFIYRGSFNNPNGNLTYVHWGSSQMLPYPGDFDGDGKLDFCVWLNGFFRLLRSSDQGIEFVAWGLFTDSRVSGDFDGDGRTDFCVTRTVNGIHEWYILERDGGGTGAVPILWGRNSLGDSRVFQSGDYDGDGLSDIAIYRRPGSNAQNTFFIRRSSDGSMMAIPWGKGNDSPVADSF